MINILNNDKWGYFNTKTSKIIPYKYKYPSDFEYGYAIVCIYDTGKYGIIDENGNIIIPFDYYSLNFITKGYYIAQFEPQGHKGIINIANETIIPCNFENIELVENGLFEVKNRYDGLSCYYNKKGLIVDERGYVLDDDIQIFNIARKLSNELYYVVTDEGIYNIIYRKNVIICFDKYKKFKSLKNGLLFFEDSIFDLEGNPLLKDYDTFFCLNNNYICFGKRYIGLYGLADNYGNILLNPKYNCIAYHRESLFKLTYQFIDKYDTGEEKYVLFDAEKQSFVVHNGDDEIFIPSDSIDLDWVDNFYNDYALIATNHKYGYIDKNFNVCIPCTNYDAMQCSHKGVFIVRSSKYGSWCLLKINNDLTKTHYELVNDFIGNYCIYRQDYKFFGVIDNEGRIIIPAIYNDGISILPDGFFEVSKGDDYGHHFKLNAKSQIVLDTSFGLIELPPTIVWVDSFSEGLVIIQDNSELYGVINEHAEIIIPCKFKLKLSSFKNGLSEIRFNVEKSFSKLSKINTSGNFVLSNNNKDNIELVSDLQFVENFINDTACAYNGEKWGLIFIDGKSITDFIYDDIQYLDINLYKVKQNNSWGIINLYGEILSDFSYERIDLLCDGFYKIYKNKKCGVLDCKGNELVKCKYLNITLKCNQRFKAIIQEESSYYHKEELFNIINYDGFIVVKHNLEEISVPQNFDYVYEFEGNYAKVQINGKLGLIDCKSNLLIPCDYDAIKSIYNDFAFCVNNKNSSLIQLNGNKTINFYNTNNAFYYNDNCIVEHSYLSYIINLNNERITEAGYTNIGHFHNGLAIVQDKYIKNDNKPRYGVIKDNGDLLLKIIYYKIDINYNQQYIKVYCNKGETEFRYYDFNGIEVIPNHSTGNIKKPSKYNFTGLFYDGLAKVSVLVNVVKHINDSDLLFEEEDEFDPFEEEHVFQKNKWGFIDENFNEICDLKYDSVSDFKDGLAVVSEKRKYGFINKNGSIVIPLLYDYARQFSEELAAVVLKRQWGFINKNNELIVKNTFSFVRDFSEGMAAVSTGDTYTPFSLFNDDFKYINDDYNDWGFVNLQGKLITHTDYEEVSDFHNGIACVSNKCDKWFYINNYGDIAFPGFFKTKVDFLNDTAELEIDNNKKYLFNKNGNFYYNGELIGPIDLSQFALLGNVNDNGFIPVRQISNHKCGYLNSSGEIVINPTFDEAGDFVNGYAYVGNSCYINEKGKVFFNDKGQYKLVPKELQLLSELTNNRILVKKKNNKGYEKYGIISKNFEVIIPCLYSSISFNHQVSNERFRLSSDKFEVDHFKCEYGSRSFYDYNRDKDHIIKHYAYINIDGYNILPSTGLKLNNKYLTTDEDLTGEYAAVCASDGWGIVDKFGNEIISCNHSYLKVLSNGYFVEEADDEKKCIIDTNNNLIIPFGDFSKIEAGKDGGFIVYHSEFGTRNYEEITDEYGQIIHIVDEWYDEHLNFNEKGEILLPLYGEEITIPKDYSWCDDSFKEGFLSVLQDGKWGAINTFLDIVVPCLYEEKIIFKDGFAIGKQYINDKEQRFVINTLGHVIISGDYDEITHYNNEHYFICQCENKSIIDVYSENGNYLFNNSDVASSIYSFKNNNFSDTLYKAISIVPIDHCYFKFQIESEMNNNISWLPIEKQRKLGMENRKWGLCDSKGKVLLQAAFSDFKGLGSGLIAAAIKPNNRSASAWGFMDILKGNIIDFIYQYVEPFSHGLAKAKKFNNPHWGLVSPNGKELTGFVYDSISDYKDGYFTISNRDGDLVNQINSQGIIHFSYYEGNDYSEGYKNDIFIVGYDWCKLICPRIWSSSSKTYKETYLILIYKDNMQGIMSTYQNQFFLPLTNLGDIKIDCINNSLCFKKENDYKNITIDGRIITYDENIKTILPQGIYWCEIWLCNLIIVETNGKKGILSKSLDYILTPEYDDIQRISDYNFYCMKDVQNKKQFLIFNAEKNSFIELDYYSISDFKNGFAIVRKLINKIKTNYSNITTKEFLYGVINKEGKEILPCNYKKIQFRTPEKNDKSHSDYNDYNEDYDWRNDYRDAFEDKPGATWGREW